MSVAFRRESDDEHLEPKFELPIPPGPNLVTPRGLRLIEERVAALEARLAEPLGEEERKSVLRDARYWRSRQASAQLAPAATGEQVAFGTRVTFEQDGRARTVEIVGHDESDPGSARIAVTAPIAQALLGSEVDEDVDLPGGQTITVTAISAA